MLLRGAARDVPHWLTALGNRIWQILIGEGMDVLREEDLVGAILIGILVEKLSQTNLSWRVQRLGILCCMQRNA